VREYAKLAPTFWTGETGRELRRRGSEAVVMALYLVSSPHSNMLGLYYQPLMYAAHETGLGIEGASKGLQCCIEVGFCSYDEDTETVFVHEMAAWQIAESLSSADKRCKGIQKDYEALPANPFLEAFHERYAAAFNLSKCRSNPAQNQRPKQAPSKPHRSQEQEQEQEQDKGHSKGLPLDFVLPDWIPSDAWEGYVAMRKRQRKPMTDRARNLKVAELQRFRDEGYDLQAILDKSTSNCWTDLYPPKGEVRQLEAVNRI